MRYWILMLLACASSGCAGTWDTLSSRRFRQNPIAALYPTDDPLTVLRTSPEGDERARAMKRLKEPIRHGGTSADQDEAISLLRDAACADPSPVVRIAAIDALAKFTDERVPSVLAAAYHQGDGLPPGAMKPARKRLDADDPIMLAERYSLRGPQGFSDDVVSAIRSRAITALSATGSAEALAVVAAAARGEGDVDHDTQLAALRGLASLRHADSVPVLVEVLKREKGRDPALTSRAHESLVLLTNRAYPADPEAWESALQSGTATVAAEQSFIQQVGAWFFR